MMIMTEQGLNAVLDSQFKFGADASLAIATIGAGVQGDHHGALGADIVAFSQTRGLYGGVSLEGSLMGQRTSWNAAYYGQRDGLAADRHRICRAPIPALIPLRDVLTRYGSGELKQAAVPAQADYQPPPPVANEPTQLQPRGQVQQQTLPPPK